MNISRPEAQFPEIHYNYTAKRIDLSSEIFVSYIDEGKGSETLLFVHGLGSYIPAWMKNIDYLKKYFRCVAFDLPGYGLSVAGVHPGTMDFYSGIISSLIIKLGLGEVNLVGHSMGGQISMTTALDYPELIKKLILISPAGFETFSEDEILWLKRFFTADIISSADINQLRINFLRNFFKMPEDADLMVRDRKEMASKKKFQALLRGCIKFFLWIARSAGL